MNLPWDRSVFEMGPNKSLEFVLNDTPLERFLQTTGSSPYNPTPLLQVVWPGGCAIHNSCAESSAWPYPRPRPRVGIVQAPLPLGAWSKLRPYRMRCYSVPPMDSDVREGCLPRPSQRNQWSLNSRRFRFSIYRRSRPSSLSPFQSASS
jgi:hypothetical protein